MKELDVLETMLKERGYEYIKIDEKKGIFPRHQIIVYIDRERAWDAICQRGSYGYEEGLLEVMGEPVVLPEDGDSVCGWLTAKEVMDRFDKWLESDKKG